ncbi:MAG: YidC/Oxa1 family insertase periplasmic-domain containing protein [Myxococcaceae bacterium]|nr:YidC/Oxa1 family insertase periplasmic-domain containing protein [Myxococcaceae bacterium]
MDSQKRLLLALVLSFVLTAIYMVLAPKPPAEAGLDGGIDGAVLLADGGVPPARDGGAQGELLPLAAAPADGGTAIAATPGEPPAPVRELGHDEAEVHYRMSTRSASLVQAELQGPKMREQRPLSAIQAYKLFFGGEAPDAPQIDMATPPDTYPAALAVGIKNGGAFSLEPWRTWRFDEAASDDDTFVFTTRQGPWEARKTLQWVHASDANHPAARGFELVMTLELRNVSSTAATGELAVHYGRGIDPTHETKASIFGSVGNESKATCVVKEDLQHLVPDQSPPKEEKLNGPVSMIGVDQQYFLGAVFPIDGSKDGRCELHATPTSRVAVGYFPITVGPGQTLKQSFGVYVGPKDSDLLRLQPSAPIAAAAGLSVPQGYSAHLQKTVNFGIWEFICVVLLAIMKFFHSIVGNWGVAIILLTVTVKLAVLPLTYKSMVSAEEMKKLQPKMAELRKKYGEDREKLNQETMKLYQEAKVNPLGGCLPMLLQMPVWIALFTTLRNSYEIYREPFFGPVWTDLTFKDPTYLFPLLLGVTMIVTQRLQPATMDASQQRIMTWFMPILFTGMMLFYPAGLTLYIFTNNLLSIAQQFAIRRYLRAKGEALAPATGPHQKKA